MLTWKVIFVMNCAEMQLYEGGFMKINGTSGCWMGFEQNRFLSFIEITCDFL